MIHSNSDVPVNSAAINIQQILPDRETTELFSNSYNQFTQKRYKEMINRRHILGHLNRWNKIISVVLYGSGAITAFLAGALNSWILSIISGSISTLGGVCDLVGKISEEMCTELDKKLKEPEKYYFKNENDENRDNINSQRVVLTSLPAASPYHLANYGNQTPSFPLPTSSSYFPSYSSANIGNSFEPPNPPNLQQSHRTLFYYRP